MLLILVTRVEDLQEQRNMYKSAEQLVFSLPAPQSVYVIRFFFKKLW